MFLNQMSQKLGHRESKSGTAVSKSGHKNALNPMKHKPVYKMS